MVKCWASVLGDCSKKQSKEHYVSKGLWDETAITVEGFDWLEGEAKTLPLTALTANILCETHNQLLSPLDSEAIAFFRTLHEIQRLQDVRLKLKPSKFWTIKRYSINGTLFERWAAKTLTDIYCVVGKDRFWHSTQTSPLEPPAEIVKAIYGATSFKQPMGLYLAHAVGDKNYFPIAVNILPLFHPDGGLVGALLKFKGVSFLIWLNEESPETFDITTSEGVTFGRQKESLIFRPRATKFTIKNVLSQVLKFEWN